MFAPSRTSTIEVRPCELRTTAPLVDRVALEADGGGELVALRCGFGEPLTQLLAAAGPVYPPPPGAPGDRLLPRRPTI
jgi:hypothetical protein